MNTKTKVKRVRTWRDVEPSRWRGFLFTLRKRPMLAAKWVLHRYVCRPVAKLARGVRRSLVRGLAVSDRCHWGEASLVRRHCAQLRAWGRVELARNFRREFNVNGKRGVL